MDSIYLKPRTDTAPGTISPAGAAVTFTVEAKSRPPGRQARFRFELDPADGFEWSSGTTTTETSAQLTGAYQRYPFQLTLRRAHPTSVVILVVPVVGELVNATGQPVSDPKRSLAFLTLGTGFAGALRQHRSLNNLTQADLAARVAVSESWISTLENGALPSEELLRELKREIES